MILVLAMQTASADKPRKCDADALDKAGADAWTRGEKQKALDSWEKAVSCEQTERRVFTAGIAACDLYQHGNDERYEKKAKRYYDLLQRSDHKQQLAQMCTPRCKLEY